MSKQSQKFKEHAEGYRTSRWQCQNENSHPAHFVMWHSTIKNQAAILNICFSIVLNLIILHSFGNTILYARILSKKI